MRQEIKKTILFYCASFLVILLNAINISRYFPFNFVQTMLAVYFGLNPTAIIFQKDMSQSLILKIILKYCECCGGTADQNVHVAVSHKCFMVSGIL